MLLWARNKQFLSVGLTLSHTSETIAEVQVSGDSGWDWSNNGRNSKKWAY